MKRLLVATLSTFTIAFAVTPAYSHEIIAYTQNMNQDVMGITPFNLVQHGYQGYFKDQGIPSNAAFDDAVNSGEIKAIDLVKSGIARGRLTSETVNDQNYIDAVQTQLDSLRRGN